MSAEAKAPTQYTCGACGRPVAYDAATEQFTRSCAHAEHGIIANVAATARGAGGTAG